MSMLTLTKTRLFAGVWEGILTGAGKDEPKLRVTHLGVELEGVELKQSKDVKGMACACACACKSDVRRCSDVFDY